MNDANTATAMGTATTTTVAPARTTERPALKHLAPGEGRSSPLGKIDLLFKTGASDGASFFVAEMVLPAGAANPLHGHATEETLYVLEGEVDMVGENGERSRATAGAVMHVPSRAAHGFVNVGPRSARILMIGPVAQEAYFLDLSAAMSGNSPDGVRDVRSRHGIESLGPIGGTR